MTHLKQIQFDEVTKEDLYFALATFQDEYLSYSQQLWEADGPKPSQRLEEDKRMEIEEEMKRYHRLVGFITKQIRIMKLLNDEE